jgi:hypothetical protein
MKKLHFLLFLSLSVVFLFPYANKLFAQLRTESNTVTTVVGNPKTPVTGGPRTPAPPCPSDCRQAIIDTFGVTFSTAFPATYYQYGWEKLWDVSHTNFDELVRGTTVQRDDNGSRRAGNTIWIRGTYPQSFFDIIFVHEMGHVINDLGDPISSRTKHNNLWSQKGGLTGYGKTACGYSIPDSNAKMEENYADLIAYYLNPEAADQTVDCSSGEVVFANGANREYFELGKQILGAY